MVYRMLVVFDQETARPPSGLEVMGSPPRTRATHPDELKQHDAESEVACKAVLERSFSSSKPSTRHMELLGHGNGVSFEATPFCSYSARDGVHVLMGGEVSEWPGVDAVGFAHNAFMCDVQPPEANDACWLFEFYNSFMMANARDVTTTALECLSQIKGSFAFVIYDSVQRRVFAARDSQGSQPLFWGATPQGHLLFGSSLDDLEGCDPTATSFPAGTLFASERHTLAFSPGERGWVIPSEEDWPGQLFSFVRDGDTWRDVRAIPRITSQGTLCGAVYKVASAHHLAPEAL